MELSKLVKGFRNEKNISIGRMAQLSGISKGTLSLWERGVNPKNPNKPLTPTIPTLQKLAKLMGYNLDELIELLDDDTKIRIPSPPKIQKEGSNVDFFPIKVYGSVPAGIPVEAIEDVVDEIYIPETWLKLGKKFIGLRVKGSSMYPKYLDGDTVVIQLQDDCESGQDCVVYVNGYEATLKTLVKNADGNITLRPINPEYEPKTYDPNDSSISILGVVKQLVRNV